MRLYMFLQHALNRGDWFLLKLNLLACPLFVLIVRMDRKNIVRDGMDGNLIALNDCNEMKEKDITING